MGPAGAGAAADRHRRAVPVGPRRLRLRQQLLRRCRAGRHAELEGDVLRLAGRRQRHHRRQAAAFLWPMEISGRIFGFSSWPCSCRRRSRASPPSRCSRRGTAHRRTRPGLLAGPLLAVTPVGGVDVPVQQPGRDADPVARWPRATRTSVRSSGRHALARCWPAACVGLGFITKMGQALLVVPAFALAYLVAAPGGAAAAESRDARRRRGDGRRSRLVDRDRRAVAGVGPAVHRRLHQQQRARAGLRLQRARPAVRRHRQRRRRRRAGRWWQRRLRRRPGLQRLFSSSGMATEISWLLPTALLALVAGLWLTRRRPRTDLSRAALMLFGAGCSSPGWCSASCRGRSTRTTRWPWRRRSPPMVAVTGALLWAARRHGRPASSPPC